MLPAVRVHTDSTAAAAAAGLQARAFTSASDIFFAPGEYAPNTRPGSKLLAHELVHVIQQRRVNTPQVQRVPTRAGRQERGTDTSAAPDTPVPEFALASYFMLVVAAGRSRLRGLERAVRRREHRIRSLPFTGRPGSTSIQLRLTDLLPATATYTSREQILNRYFDLLGTTRGPSSAAGWLAGLIADNEALRTYLENKRNALVSVELVDPHGATGGSTRLRFTVGGVEVRDFFGQIPVESLDAITSERLAVVQRRARLAAQQLVAVATAERQARYATRNVVDLAARIEREPEKFSLLQAQELDRAATLFAGRVTRLRDGLLEGNADQRNRMTRVAADAGRVRVCTQASLAALRGFHGRTVPELTSGEAYQDYSAEQVRYMSGNWAAGGWGYGWAGLNAAEWAATQFWQTAGNIFTLGSMGREARNASLYRRGQISYEAYRENVWWNLGASLVTGAVIVLTAGWGSQLAATSFGITSTWSPGVAAAVSGMGEGLVIGSATAVGSDIYSAAAMRITDVPGVRAYHESSIVGPLGYLESGMTAGLLGGGLAWGGSFVRPAGPSGAGSIGTVPVADWAATRVAVASDLAVTRLLAARAAQAPIPAAELGGLLRPGLSGRAAHGYLNWRGVQILYRGQGAPTSEILSPIARGEAGVGASLRLYQTLRAQGLSDVQIAGYTARWSGQPVPAFDAPPGLAAQPLGAAGIPTTRIPAVASHMARTQAGGRPVVYVLRVPRSAPIDVAGVGWGRPGPTQSGVESEWVIMHQVPNGYVVMRIPASRVPPLVADSPPGVGWALTPPPPP